MYVEIGVVRGKLYQIDCGVLTLYCDAAFLRAVMLFVVLFAAISFCKKYRFHVFLTLFPHSFIIIRQLASSSQVSGEQALKKV